MKLYLIFLSFLFVIPSFSQSEDLLVTSDSTVFPVNSLSLQIKDLSFIKNNEYFNLIADGYTLFGNKLNVEGVYTPHSHYDLTAGIMLLKYYGLDDFSAAIPYLSLRIHEKNHTYYFGKLYTEDHHHLSRQLYAFERHLDKRSIENGIEYRYNSRNWLSDTWLEWEHFIQKYDDKRERLNFGHYSAYTYISKQWKLSIPFQIYLHHRGGQINMRTSQTAGLNNALVVANMALGGEWKRNLSSDDYAGIRIDAFWHFINSDNTEEFYFDRGKAFQGQIFYQNKTFRFNVNYWKSDKFISSKGDDMFQSVSRRIDKYMDKNNKPAHIFASHTEPDRELLYLDFNYKKEIFKDLFLAFSTDIFYQLNASRIDTDLYSNTIQKQLDYNMSLFLIYKFKHTWDKL